MNQSKIGLILAATLCCGILALTTVITHSLVSAAAPSVTPTAISTDSNCAGALVSRLQIGMLAVVSPTPNGVPFIPLKLYSSADKTSTSTTAIGDGTPLQVTGGSVCVGQTIWWQIHTTAAQGWVIESSHNNYLIDPAIIPPAALSATPDPNNCPNTPTTRFSVGMYGVIAPPDPGKPANLVALHDQASRTSKAQLSLHSGQQFQVTDGPQCAQGFTWWKVQAGPSAGWLPEGDSNSYYLVPLTAQTIPNAIPTLTITPIIMAQRGTPTSTAISTPSAQNTAPQLSTITAKNIAQIKPLFSALIDKGTILSPNKNLIAGSTLSSPPAVGIVDLSTGRLTTVNASGTPFAFNADSTAILTSNQESTSMWNIATNKQLFTVPGRAIKIDPTNQYLVTQSIRTTVWRIKDGQQLLIPPLANWINNDPFESIFSADGNFMEWITPDSIHVWSIPTNNEQLTIPFSGFVVRDIHFSPDNTTLAFASNNKIILWNINSKQQHLTINFQSDLSQFLFSPDATQLIVFSDKQPVITLLNTQNGQVTGTLPSDIVYKGYVQAIFDPLNRFWWFQVALGSLHAWDPKNNREMTVPTAVAVDLSRAWFNTDGTLIFIEKQDPSGINSAYTEVRDPATWALLYTLPGAGFSLAQNDSSLVIAYDRVLLAFAIPTTNYQPQPLTLPGRAVNDIALHTEPSASSKTIRQLYAETTGLASGQNNGYLFLIDQNGWVKAAPDYFALDGNLPYSDLSQVPATGNIGFTPTPVVTETPWFTQTPTNTPTPNAPTQTLASLSPAAPITLVPASIDAPAITTTNVNQVQLLAAIPADYVSDDGQTLLRLTPSPQVWHLSNGTKPLPLPIKYEDNMRGLLSHNGQTFAYVLPSDTNIVHLFDLSSNQEKTFTAQRLDYNIGSSSIFSPDDSQLLIITSSSDGNGRSINNLNVHTARLISTISLGLNLDDYPLHFSPNNQLIAVTDSYGPIRLWNAATGAEMGVLETTDTNVLFSPDSATLVTWDHNSANFSIWDVSTRTLKFTFQGPYSYSVYVRLSPDGRSLLIDKVDPPYPSIATVSVWNTSTGSKTLQLNGIYSLFNDNNSLWITNHTPALTLYDLNGKILSSVPWPCSRSLALSSDRHWLGCGTTLVDTTTAHTYNLVGNYGNSGNGQFSADNSHWLIFQTGTWMIFGIPTAAQPAWQPVSARITVSGLSVHKTSDSASPVIDTVSGTVTISGTDATHQWLYVPAKNGWINPDYVKLQGVTINDLPIVTEQP